MGEHLTKNDVTELKAFAKPPAAVILVCHAACVLLRVKAVSPKKPDWALIKKVLLQDPSFLRRVKVSRLRCRRLGRFS